MQVVDISVTENSSWHELRANVHFETHWVWGDEPFVLWYRVPLDYGDYRIANTGDPLLAALLAPAMRLHENLVIEGPISPKLLAATEGVQSIYQSWDRSLRGIEIRVPSTKSVLRDTPPPAAGLFYSLGVDSTYSLLKSFDQVDGDSHIAHLINVLGFDIYLWESEAHVPVQSRIQDLARNLGIEHVTVITNLRELTDRIVDWPRVSHGGALASPALALQPLFRRITISASATYSTLGPWGSHPLLDPLWSTESTTFIHDGCEERHG